VKNGGGIADVESIYTPLQNEGLCTTNSILEEIIKQMVCMTIIKEQNIIGQQYRFSLNQVIQNELH
jgi:hypothetical protein